MKKILKIIGGILLIIIILLIVLFVYLSKRPAVLEAYNNKIETGGEIETRYLSEGKYENIERMELDAFENYKKYIMYYPKKMGESSKKFPAVIFSNGTGVKVSKYEAQLKRLATWGFIVIGTEEEYSWNGFSSEMCLRLMIKLNNNEQILDWDTNPFYNSIDLDNIGVIGHSQGGVGVINAATENKNGYKIKTIVALSPTNMELAHNLEWDYNPSLIQVPTLLISGTGDIDEKTVVSNSQLLDIYNSIPGDILKVKMRRANVDHGETISIADGYVTSWFMWHLQGDEEAKKAFVGDNAEILNNEFYQDIDKNF